MTQAVADTEVAAVNGSSTPIVELDNIRKYFPITKGVLLRRLVGEVKAVDGVSFQIRKAKPTASSVSPAAAKPLPPAWCCRLKRPPKA